MQLIQINVNYAADPSNTSSSEGCSASQKQPQTAPTHGASGDPWLCPGELLGGLDTHVQTCPV